MPLLQIVYSPIGFDLAFFILGMAGGFIRSITHDKTGLKQSLINVIVGGITSNYFTAIISRKFGLEGKEYLFAVGLLLGFFAVGVFVVFERLEGWAKQNPKNFLSFLINNFAGMIKGTQDEDKTKTPNGSNNTNADA